MTEFERLMGNMMLGSITPTTEQATVMAMLIVQTIEGNRLDFITVAEGLEKGGVLEEVGGLEYISMLAANA